jgi:hypothetical protein
MKIVNARRELRPDDLQGAKIVFGVIEAIVRMSNGTDAHGWLWHQGTKFVRGDAIYGPFRSEKAARDNALQNCQMMN